ncbi:MAG: hypothetical protein GC155_16775 [Alphaproteobacteria bacterium]|nr:hypothetical protein [Alphaproteobacteria bacterium]
MGRRLGAITLLAMLVRAIVPAGYMLATADTPDGRYLTVTICEAQNPGMRMMDMTTGEYVDPSTVPLHHHDGGHDQNDHGQCVFAVAAHMASPAADVTAEPPLVSRVAATIAPFDVEPGESNPAQPPPSTGPPAPTELS